MSVYSVKERTGDVKVQENGTVVVEVSWRLFLDNKVLAKGSTIRTIKPADDLTGDTSRAAKLAEAARKLATDERTVEAVTR